MIVVSNDTTYPIYTIVHHLRTSEKHPLVFKALYHWVERIYLNSVQGYVFNSKTTEKSVASLGIDLKACFQYQNLAWKAPDC